MTEPSKRPWYKLYNRVITTDDAEEVASCSRLRGVDIAEANAAHIVRCVNAHDELVAAAEAAVDGMTEVLFPECGAADFCDLARDNGAKDGCKHLTECQWLIGLEQHRNRLRDALEKARG